MFNEKNMIRTPKKDNTVVLKVDGKPFWENLPEGISEKEMKAALKYQSDYSEEFVKFAGEVAAKEFNQHKDTEKVEVVAGFGPGVGRLVSTVYKSKKTMDGKGGFKHVPAIGLTVKSSMFKPKKAIVSAKEHLSATIK